MFSKRTGWELAPNRFTRSHLELTRLGRSLIDLTISNPTICGFQFDSEKISRPLNNSMSLTYSPDPQGLFSGRAAVSAYYSSLAVPAKVPPDNIVLTTSTSEGYSFVFRLLCDPGDEVLVPQPGYPLFDLLADIQDVHPVPYSLVYDHGWQIDFNSLRASLSPKTSAIIIVNPNNPTGLFLKPADLAELNSICTQHAVAMISDEVFLDYGLNGHSGHSTAANSAALTFTLSGLSKICGLPQMKVSWIAVSGPESLLRNAMSRLELISDTYLSMNAPLQHAIPDLLSSRTAFQSQLMARVRTNLTELDKQLSYQKHCTRLTLEGGWYATLRVPVTQSDEDLAIQLMKAVSVLVQPGHFFDFQQEGYLVLSLLTPEKDFAEGLSKVLKHIAKL